MKAGIAILGAIALGAVGGWYARQAGPWSAAQAAPATAELETVPATLGSMGATVLATGVIRPQVGAEVAVGSRVSGILKALHATVGDRVGAGQLLAELDPTEFEARVEQAEASLASATAERDFAETEYRRAETLVSGDFIPRAEFERAERGLEVAEARVREAGATLETSRIQLGYTRITAPISGVVASVTTQVGETVAASFAAPTFVTIIDLDRLEVWAYVDETDIGRVEVGQRATFSVDTYPGTEFPGEVIAIRPSAEIQANVVNYVTVIRIGDQLDRMLRPEMTTTVNIEMERREGVLTIPNGAVRRDAAGTHAMVVTGGVAERRPIETGFRGRDRTEIVRGLAEGDRVVVGSLAHNP